MLPKWMSLLHPPFEVMPELQKTMLPNSMLPESMLPLYPLFEVMPNSFDTDDKEEQEMLIAVLAAEKSNKQKM